jgi:DNA-directed RNA polymerase specialized sigma24 family protein
MSDDDIDSAGEPNVDDLIAKASQPGGNARDQLSEIVRRGVSLILQRSYGETASSSLARHITVYLINRVREGAITSGRELRVWARDAIAAARAELGDSTPPPLLKSPSRSVMEAINRLSPRERGILQRYYVSGWQPDRICSKFGIAERDFCALKDGVRNAALSASDSPSQPAVADERSSSRSASVMAWLRTYFGVR